MDDESELPPIKDENAPAIEEEHREPAEDAEPFSLDVIPETEQHLIDDAKKKKGEILQAIDDGDLKKVRAAAFEFKGLSDNLRIEEVSQSPTKLLRHEQLPALKREAEHFYSLLSQR
ncbi:MAG: hypothetical protein IE886_05005 [Campylobacterales bacterium]|nr:hypothetical protein [Campylobacterales bacterium]